MKNYLRLLFGSIFLCMLFVTVRASLQISILDVWDSFAANPWAVATLYDAYFGFLTIYVWVAYKERSWTGRIAWFLLIMCLGNISIALYMLLQLSRWKDGDPIEALLLR